jgi:dsDNA-specific endonuclease/ATPase MutS2
MKNTVRLSESQLINLIRKSIKEQENDRYMFFSNLEQIHRQTGLMLEMNENELHQILENGHDWAQDHIATAKESIDQVFDFFMNETNNHDDDMLMDEPEIMEGRKKTGTKLCARGKAAAKAKFKVYPSAYSNGFAVQVCQGKIKGLDGKRHCSGAYC